MFPPRLDRNFTWVNNRILLNRSALLSHTCLPHAGSNLGGFVGSTENKERPKSQQGRAPGRGKAPRVSGHTLEALHTPPRAQLR